MNGRPPALAGRLPEFDSSGSDLRVRVVNCSRSTTGTQEMNEYESLNHTKRSPGAPTFYFVRQALAPMLPPCIRGSDSLITIWR